MVELQNPGLAGASALSADGPLCVLVVDDSRLQRRILTASLRKWGFLVQEADSGLSALEICRLNPPDIVISDWMMPEMDGLTFCRNFRDMRRDSYGYFVLLTSKSEKGEVAQGLHCGADDFLTKPVAADELRARLTAGERILRMEKQLQRQNHVIRETLAELTEIHQAMDRDLLQAREIQQRVLPAPETKFTGGSISSLLHSCGHVGGDLVGHFNSDDGKIGLYNIDVSGHGIMSALMTARISGYLSDQFPDQNLALEHVESGEYTMREPAQVACLLNDRLTVDAGAEQYFTMAFASANLTTGQVSLVQAGHPNPVLIPAHGPPEFIGNGGFPIGLLPDAPYQQFNITLTPGDRLLLYSDGFVEAALPEGKMLEEHGLIELIRQARHLKGRAFLDAIYNGLWCRLPDAHQLDDDVSAIMLEYGQL